MANKTIYNLGNSTVPLVGTEVIPLWDGAATKKVTVDNLTAGKHVDTADLYAVKTSAGAVVDVVTVQNLSSNAGTEAGVFLAPTSATGNIRGARITAHNDGSNVIKLKFYTGIGAAITEKYDLSSDSNLIPLIAAKNINFTANTPAAGMTSQLLNWYEEGTWTPSVGGTATYTIQSGTYTRIGRVVHVKGSLQINAIGTGSTSVVSGLPYSADGFNSVLVGYFSNLATNVLWISGYAASGTTVRFTSATAATATATDSPAIFGNNARVEFSITYNV